MRAWPSRAVHNPAGSAPAHEEAPAAGAGNGIGSRAAGGCPARDTSNMRPSAPPTNSSCSAGSVVTLCRQTGNDTDRSSVPACECATSAHHSSEASDGCRLCYQAKAVLTMMGFGLGTREEVICGVLVLGYKLRILSTILTDLGQGSRFCSFCQEKR